MFLTTRPRVASIAVVGRPNVEKSSLLDALISKERVIASEVPATTRDAIDTVGARKKPAPYGTIEYYSALRSLNAVARSDIVLLVFDAVFGVTPQDRRLAGIAIEEGKGLIFVGSKWDIECENGEFSQSELANAIHDLIPFARFAPILFNSVETDCRSSSLLRVVDHVAENLDRRIPAAELNTVVRDAILTHPVPAGRQFEIYHASQAASHPPVFVFRCNDPERIQPHDRRFLENVIREHFDFQGVPLTLQFHSSAKPKGRSAPHHLRAVP